MSKTQSSSCHSCCGSAGSVDITGCRMGLYPMSDTFVDIILSAVQKIDTSKVWASTDHLSTVYRGRQTHVVDCAKAAFVYAQKKDVHMVGEFTFSKGCPGDVDADRYLASDDLTCNNTALADGEFYTYAKISLYCFGIPNYMEHIAYIVNLAKQKGLKPQSAHYVTMLEGSANALFSYFEEALAYAHQHIPHYVLEATLSVNSPTPVANIKGE